MKTRDRRRPQILSCDYIARILSCEQVVKKTGLPCSNKASWSSNGLVLCGIHTSTEVKADENNRLTLEERHFFPAFQMPIIDEFIFFGARSREYSELSNSFPVEFIWCGFKWESSEHTIQASKFIYSSQNPELNKRLVSHAYKILQCETPQEAKFLGRNRYLPIRPDWHTNRETIILAILDAKFSQNQQLKDILQSTRNKILRNGKNDDDNLGYFLCILRENNRK